MIIKMICFICVLFGFTTKKLELNFYKIISIKISDNRFKLTLLYKMRKTLYIITKIQFYICSFF